MSWPVQFLSQVLWSHLFSQSEVQVRFRPTIYFWSSFSISCCHTGSPTPIYIESAMYKQFCASLTARIWQPGQILVSILDNIHDLEKSYPLHPLLSFDKLQTQSTQTWQSCWITRLCISLSHHSKRLATMPTHSLRPRWPTLASCQIWNVHSWEQGRGARV